MRTLARTLLLVALVLPMGVQVSGAQEKSLASPVVSSLDAEVQALVARVYPAFVLIGGGSGVCISEDGYFLTNHHVWTEAAEPVDRAVYMAGNSRMFTADSVGADPRGDIVLGKIRLAEGETLPFAKLGDSDKVRPGDICLSVGNPFLLAQGTFEPTVTLGTITANNRFQGGYNDSLQIDTAINPGNSGGPSFNIDGEVIGINGRNISYHGKRFNTGGGYAIPSNQIANFIDAMKAQEGGARVVRHGFVGGLTFDLGSKTRGAVVSAVADNTEARDAGFQAGDVIVEMDGKAVFNAFRYYGIVGTRPRNSQFAFRVKRGEELITLVARNDVPTEAGQFGTIPRSDDEARDAQLGPQADPFQLPRPKSIVGAEVAFNQDRKVGGLVITRVVENGAMAAAGLQAGDILLEINKRRVTFRADLTDVLLATPGGSELPLKILRDGKEIESKIVTGTAQRVVPPRRR